MNEVHRGMEAIVLERGAENARLRMDVDVLRRTLEAKDEALRDMSEALRETRAALERSEESRARSSSSSDEAVALRQMLDEANTSAADAERMRDNAMAGRRRAEHAAESAKAELERAQQQLEELERESAREQLREGPMGNGGGGGGQSDAPTQAQVSAAEVTRLQNLLEEMRVAVVHAQEREQVLEQENEALLMSMRGQAPRRQSNGASIGERLRSSPAATAASSFARRVSQRLNGSPKLQGEFTPC